MHPARASEPLAQPSWRRRATSFALAIGINLLILLALLTLNAPAERRPPRGAGPVLLDLAPVAEPAPAVTQAEVAPQARAQVRAEADVRPVDPVLVPPRREDVPPVPTEAPLPFLVISREDYAASDIARFGNRTPSATPGQGLASGRPDSQQVGTAPNGEPLYHAEWYRRPTRAELSSYLPANGRVEGWGLIACRTVARYRVEDCVELADSPPGSRLAGAVRQAAWQFLVRPPRVGGKELVGTWVRIRIEYRAAEEDG
jgi:protein TonB